MNIDKNSLAKRDETQLHTSQRKKEECVIQTYIFL